MGINEQDFLCGHDEYKYVQNSYLKQKRKDETLTFRHSSKDIALPLRKAYGSFDAGYNVGGVHWNGMSYRFLPYDFEIKTQTNKIWFK